MKTIKLKSGTELPVLNLKGKDYLQVAYRLVWFREEHPDWSIVTEFVTLTDKYAVAKATIHTPHGQVMATAHKQETVQGFQDHLEKAETGAIGRALALCGYGTQFEPEFDEGDRLADSPLGGSPVTPSQPHPNEGVQKEGYVMPAMTGKLAGKYLNDIHLSELINYVDVLMKRYQDKTIPPVTQSIMDRVVDRIMELENGAQAIVNLSDKKPIL